MIVRTGMLLLVNIAEGKCVGVDVVKCIAVTVVLNLEHVNVVN